VEAVHLPFDQKLAGKKRHPVGIANHYQIPIQLLRGQVQVVGPAVDNGKVIP
jgi:hypothetical protein